MKAVYIWGRILIHCCSEPPAPQGYGQWLGLELMNRNSKNSGISMWITTINLEWGKLYDCQDMDHEIDPKTVIGTEIKPGKSYTFCTCGRQNSASGTEGTVTLAGHKDGSDHISDIYWSCPWGPKDNILKVSNTDPNWIIQVPPISSGGPIGRVTIVFVNLSD